MEEDKLLPGWLKWPNLPLSVARITIDFLHVKALIILLNYATFSHFIFGLSVLQPILLSIGPAMVFHVFYVLNLGVGRKWDQRRPSNTYGGQGHFIEGI